MRIGFIGLGNAGGKLAGSLLRNGYDLTVRDLDPEVARSFVDGGASWADSPREMAEACDVVITCLPSPAACSAVMEADDGVLAGLRAVAEAGADAGGSRIWLEMSTTDESEVRRIGALVVEAG
ncbi:MAG TPA: NAD(P)-binding domain-containing protein, partial [Acidimicrobiales bacterium]|nr:NAD(P)-binding domain-containing protein [Acidimicrobiales bacterium]